MTTVQTKGSDLKVGQTIKVWWSSSQRRAGKPPNEDTITELTPYKGPLSYLFPQGAQIAVFAHCPGMTIDNSDYYEVVVMESAVSKPLASEPVCGQYKPGSGGSYRCATCGRAREYHVKRS